MDLTPQQIASMACSAVVLGLTPFVGQHPELGGWSYVVSTIPDLVGKFSERAKPRVAARLIREHLDEVVDRIPGIEDETTEEVRDAFLVAGEWTAMRIYRAVVPRERKDRKVKTEVTEEETSTLVRLLGVAPPSLVDKLRASMPEAQR